MITFGCRRRAAGGGRAPTHRCPPAGSTSSPLRTGTCPVGSAAARTGNPRPPPSPRLCMPRRIGHPPAPPGLPGSASTAGWTATHRQPEGGRRDRSRHLERRARRRPRRAGGAADPPTVSSAVDAAGPGVGVPEADALEQQLAARPGEAGSPRLRSATGRRTRPTSSSRRPTSRSTRTTRCASTPNASRPLRRRHRDVTAEGGGEQLPDDLVAGEHPGERCGR